MDTERVRSRVKMGESDGRIDRYTYNKRETVLSGPS